MGQANRGDEVSENRLPLISTSFQVQRTSDIRSIAYILKNLVSETIFLTACALSIKPLSILGNIFTHNHIKKASHSQIVIVNKLRRWISVCMHMSERKFSPSMNPRRTNYMRPDDQIGRSLVCHCAHVVVSVWWWWRFCMWAQCANVYIHTCLLL